MDTRHDEERILDRAERTAVKVQAKEDLDVLLESNKTQTKLIGDLAVTVGTLADQVDNRPTKRGVTWIVSIVASVILAISIAVSYLGYDESHKVNNQIADCITPDGECAHAQAAATQQFRGQIVCNQEKIVYFLDPEDYSPLPFCVEIINSEIDRLVDEGKSVEAPRLEEPDGVIQITPLKETFAELEG